MDTVKVESFQNLRQIVSTRSHSWLVDEPPMDGDGLGPNPYELLLGSLAACTCITLALYCRHKKIALEKVTAS